MYFILSIYFILGLYIYCFSSSLNSLLNHFSWCNFLNVKIQAVNLKIVVYALYNLPQQNNVTLIKVVYVVWLMRAIILHSVSTFNKIDKFQKELSFFWTNFFQQWPNLIQSNLTFIPTLGRGWKLALWWGGIRVGEAYSADSTAGG